jgi:hypothetical protein
MVGRALELRVSAGLVALHLVVILIALVAMGILETTTQQLRLAMVAQASLVAAVVVDKLVAMVPLAGLMVLAAAAALRQPISLAVVVEQAATLKRILHLPLQLIHIQLKRVKARKRFRRCRHHDARVVAVSQVRDEEFPDILEVPVGRWLIEPSHVVIVAAKPLRFFCGVRARDGAVTESDEPLTWDVLRALVIRERVKDPAHTLDHDVAHVTDRGPHDRDSSRLLLLNLAPHILRRRERLAESAPRENHPHEPAPHGRLLLGASPEVPIV